MPLFLVLLFMISSFILGILFSGKFFMYFIDELLDSIVDFVPEDYNIIVTLGSNLANKLLVKIFHDSLKKL